jgi:DNA-binding protein H-NS
MSIDLTTLSPAQLEELMRQAAARKAEISKQHKDDARRQVAQLAQELGYSIDELFGSGQRVRSALAVRYRNPANPRETWVGRGKRPAWVSAALASGLTLENLRA